MITTKTIQVAPMVGVTTEHFNYFIRLISEDIGLYTEMTSTNSIRHGKVLDRFNYKFSKQIIQLAGNIPSELAFCAMKAEHMGFSGVNLNVGCPSCKIKKANYGAILFKYPALVAECVKAMKKSCNIPISVKTRIGVDHIDNYQYLRNFVSMLIDSGCDEIIIHARKAYLKGLSPKANRTVPPLRYDVVKRLVEDFPDANFCLNGGISSLSQVRYLLGSYDNLMLGRVIEKNPLIIREIYKHLGLETSIDTRHEILSRYLRYVEQRIDTCNRIMLLKPLFGLYYGTRIAKKWHCSVIDSFNKKNTRPFDKLLSLANCEGV